MRKGKSQQKLGVGLRLAHRLQRCPSIKPTLGQHVVFAGMANTLTKVRRAMQKNKVSKSESGRSRVVV